ncbi:hypothetical protein AB8O64_04785 [Streptomyces sp. QH1-20]|uniref:hypothetical protein n=1 Tax=Streptomyces sp. QH1-20 TaxID=3240934 RepID=UPI003511F3A4
MKFKQRFIFEGGDEDRQTATLAAVAKTSGGSAFSTNQETTLLDGTVDVVLHSLNNLPTSMPEGHGPIADGHVREATHVPAVHPAGHGPAARAH